MAANLTGIKVKGYIKVTTTNVHTGEEIVVYDGPNLIVSTGLEVLSRLIAQVSAAPATDQLTTVRFGTDPTQPALGDTDVGSAISLNPDQTISQALENIGPVGLTEFTVTLAAGDGNSTPAETVAEVGLLTAGSVLFARQVIPGIVKDANIAITLAWRVQFTS